MTGHLMDAAVSQMCDFGGHQGPATDESSAVAAWARAGVDKKARISPLLAKREMRLSELEVMHVTP